MAKVAVVVEFNLKEIEEILKEEAKAQAGAKAGGSSIELLYNIAERDNPRQLIGARVSFNGVANKT